MSVVGNNSFTTDEWKEWGRNPITVTMLNHISKFRNDMLESTLTIQSGERLSRLDAINGIDFAIDIILKLKNGEI